VQISPESVDTSGYFDEIGVEIAENFPLYRRVLGGIRWAQQEKRSSCKIYLEKYSEADAQMLIAFCQRLYDTTFISRCLHSREENSLRLQVQDAKNIQHFFDGGWLEWHALMMILKSAQQRGLPFACARNLIVNFSPNEKCELDVFALVGGTPICIEAKSGEYRSFIEKMRYLRKKLGCSQERCIFCIAGLETEKLAALSAMHQLAFTNEKTIAEHLQNVLQDIKILK